MAHIQTEIRDLKNRLAHAERRANNLELEVERVTRAHRLLQDKTRDKFTELYSVITRIDKSYLSLLSNLNVYQPLGELGNETHDAFPEEPHTLRDVLKNTRT